MVENALIVFAFCLGQFCLAGPLDVQGDETVGRGFAFAADRVLWLALDIGSDFWVRDVAKVSVHTDIGIWVALFAIPDTAFAVETGQLLVARIAVAVCLTSASTHHSSAYIVNAAAVAALSVIVALLSNRSWRAAPFNWIHSRA